MTDKDVLVEMPIEAVYSPYEGLELFIAGSDKDPAVIRQKKWDVAFMAAAVGNSVLSHCTRHKVACTIVQGRRPIATGINGTTSGHKNCDEVFTEVPEVDSDGYEKYLEDHKRFSEENEHHAEANAISWCARKGIAVEGAFIYTTLSPCLPCAKKIVSSGIVRCYYLETYDRDPKGLLHLEKNGVEIVHVDVTHVAAHIVATQKKLLQGMASKPERHKF